MRNFVDDVIHLRETHSLQVMVNLHVGWGGLGLFLRFEKRGKGFFGIWKVGERTFCGTEKVGQGLFGGTNNPKTRPGYLMSFAHSFGICLPISITSLDKDDTSNTAMTQPLTSPHYIRYFHQWSSSVYQSINQSTTYFKCHANAEKEQKTRLTIR